MAQRLQAAPVAVLAAVQGPRVVAQVVLQAPGPSNPRPKVAVAQAVVPVAAVVERQVLLAARAAAVRLAHLVEPQAVAPAAPRT